MFFDLVSFAIISFSFGVVLTSSPVISLFCMLFVFGFGSLLFFNLGAHFLAVVYIIVYMGAVTVLFLFVVMMLNPTLSNLSLQKFRIFAFSTLIFCGLIIAIFSAISIFFDINFYFFQSFNSDIFYQYTNWFSEINLVSNIQSLGQLIYTLSFFNFICAGLILFAAMIGAIYLTLNRVASFSYYQVIFKQLEKSSQVWFFKK